MTDDKPVAPDSRLKLLWDVVVFQLKLTADGVRDLVLVPISLISAILGVLAGGNDPARFFRQVLQFGRRTEVWINLFGHRRHAATSDALLKPWEGKILAGASTNPALNEAGERISRSLDSIQNSIDRKTGDAARRHNKE